jgi:biuret amidohydrolase
VIYTAHVHRRDGSDMGLYDDLYSPIADRSTLVDGTKGVEKSSQVWLRPQVNTSSKNTATAHFLALIWTSYCASGASPR